MFIQTGMEKILSCRMDGGIGMARKSRKNRNVESNIQTVVKKENLLDTAAYIRLSVENGGNETDETLVVQQMLVERFIEEHPDLRLEEVYIDNGFTGTNFERPGFMRLMGDVRSGKVQCIVVKDLSRFGRDYLETGYYLETILPKLNVRFIAITDDYDSSRKEDRENISVPIKNMVNAMYAKDMSKKILAAKEAQKRNGNITLSKVAFGYVRSEDKTRQVVDETVAPVVRMIFQWTLLGVSKREIADRLNLLGVATPGQKEKRKIVKVPLGETKWNGGTVRKILENPTYTGDIVTGKLKQSLYKGVKQYHTEPEEWDVQKDMHTPLVARDDYEELQESREEIHKITKKHQSRCMKDREKYQDSFPGMVRCGECGNVMYFRRYTHNYTTNEKRDEKNPEIRYMYQVKSNLAPESNAIGFVMNPDKGFQWIGKCNIDKRAEAVVCSKKATKKEKASEYLRIMLSVEDVPSAEIIRRMDRIGIKERTIRTVQKEIGIEAYRKQGIWYWHMPEPEEEVDEE